MTQTSRRGFAAMNPERQREIASEGGRAAHESGHAHEWNSREAAEAGRRGGRAAHQHRNPSFRHEPTAQPERQAAQHYRNDNTGEVPPHVATAGNHTERAEQPPETDRNESDARPRVRAERRADEDDEQRAQRQEP